MSSSLQSIQKSLAKRSCRLRLRNPINKRQEINQVGFIYTQIASMSTAIPEIGNNGITLRISLCRKFIECENSLSTDRCGTTNVTGELMTSRIPGQIRDHHRYPVACISRNDMVQCFVANVLLMVVLKT